MRYSNAPLTTRALSMSRLVSLSDELYIENCLLGPEGMMISIDSFIEKDTAIGDF